MVTRPSVKSGEGSGEHEINAVVYDQGGRKIGVAVYDIECRDATVVVLPRGPNSCEMA